MLGILDCSEGLPDRLIPFGIDAGGAYFCFDYRLTHIDPPVVFFVTNDLNAVPE